MGNRFYWFTKDEMYILKRAFIESSANFVFNENYTDEERKIHQNLMNEVIEAIKAEETFFEEEG